MPIDKAEWDKGRTADTLETQIEKFLILNRGKAFTQLEIVKQFFPIKSDTFLDIIGNFAIFLNVNAALTNLMREGGVKSKLVKNASIEEQYYTLAK